MSNTSTRNIWDTMIQRCHNPNRKDFWRYGGRGIVVCQRWRDSFQAFLDDMGMRPPGLSLDRKNNALGYSPENCRWATAGQQVRNSSAAKFIEIDGRSQCIVDWCKETGIVRATYEGRVARGWTQERALTTPPDQRCNNGKRGR